ncbi:glycosyl transferase [alpha proteobacterium U9-1i]|nr:glycosyl transferase [alpha proteobacterium U9-1i]
MISVIIPTLNSAAHLSRAFAALAPAAMSAFVKEVIVADAGSTDATLVLAEDSGCEIVRAESGASQWIAGAAAARGRWLLLMRPETRLAPGWEEKAVTYARANHKRDRAASFASRPLAPFLRSRTARGVLIGRRFYDALGGVRDGERGEAGLMQRIGGRMTYL